MKKEHERGKNKCFKADINYSTNFDSVRTFKTLETDILLPWKHTPQKIKND